MKPSYYHSTSNRSQAVTTVSASGANAGHIGYWDVPIWASDCTTVEPDDSGSVAGRFMFHQLKEMETRIQATLRRGAAQPHVYAKDIADLEVFLPPFEEQRRIASILDAADELRTKRQQAIERLDTLTQAIFIGMFGDPNKNPRGLTKQALVELVKFKSGEGLTSKAMRPGDYSVYGGNGINGTHDAYRFEQPQVVVGRVGVYCGCVHLSEPKSWITDNALYVARMSDNLTRTYLAAALRQANLNQYANQAAQPLISGARVYPVEILVPPKTEQLMFEEAIEVQAAVKVSIGSSERALDTLFSSLQQRAFRGDL